mmetsp:Transcript_51723/g.117812  ORF Transcript_51723/g.117812 Transcript_51723/m.117812 type:complete len:92 (-) Transcript_51723:498-773(-)
MQMQATIETQFENQMIFISSFAHAPQAPREGVPNKKENTHDTGSAHERTNKKREKEEKERDSNEIKRTRLLGTDWGVLRVYECAAGALHAK